MSVLYKALQKAEKENEQRQTTASGKGFDPERLAGSGAIRRVGGARLTWRVGGLAAVGLLAILVIGFYVFTQTQSSSSPRVATTGAPPPVAVPSVATVKAPPPSAPSATAVAQASAQQAATASVPVAPSQPPQSSAAPRSSQAAPVSPAEAAAKQAVPPVAQAEKSEAPAMKVAKAEVPASNVPQADAPPSSVVPAKAATPKEPAVQKPVEIPRDSPAQMLNPPISVSRSDFALSGVGNAVQVRQIAKDAQDNVGAGYNALLRGEYDTSLGFYDRALAKEPTSVLALLGRGAALQKLHRLTEAYDAYTKALDVDPENREALTNITAIIAERAPGEALNRLIDLEKQYQTFSPIKAQIGLLYAKMGNMEQALDYLRRAVTLSPESLIYQYNLALVLDHMNLREQAIAAYEHVLSSITVSQAPPEFSSSEIERRVRYLRAH